MSILQRSLTLCKQAQCVNVHFTAQFKQPVASNPVPNPGLHWLTAHCGQCYMEEHDAPVTKTGPSTLHKQQADTLQEIRLIVLLTCHPQ